MTEATAQESADAAVARGRQALEEEAYEVAAAHFKDALAEKALPTDGQDTAAYYWLGLAYGKKGKPEEQLRAWEEGLAAWRQAGRFSF